VLTHQLSTRPGDFLRGECFRRRCDGDFDVLLAGITVDEKALIAPR